MRLNVVILGPTGVGKSLLAYGLSSAKDQYMRDGLFKYEQTIGVSPCFLHHASTTIKLYDLGGDDRFLTIRKTFITGSNHFIIVVNAASATLNADVEKCLAEIKSAKKEQETYQILLVMHEVKNAEHHSDRISLLSDSALQKIAYIAAGCIVPDPTDSFICGIRKMIMHRFADEKSYEGQITQVVGKNPPAYFSPQAFFSSSFFEISNRAATYFTASTARDAIEPPLVTLEEPLVQKPK